MHAMAIVYENMHFEISYIITIHFFLNMVEHIVAMPLICSTIWVYSFWILLIGNTLGEIAGEKAGIFKVLFWSRILSSFQE